VAASEIPFTQINAPANQYLPTSIECWLAIADRDTNKVLPGLDRIPITHVTLDFPLRGLAQASFILATGYDAITKRIADINKTTQNLDYRFRIWAYAKFKGRESIDKVWPDFFVRIWDGLSISPGFTRSRQTTAITLQSVHWIYELDEGTMASQDIIKNAADNLLVSYGLETAQGNQPANAAALASRSKPGDLFWDGTYPIIKALVSSIGEDGLLQPQYWEQTVKGLNSCKLPGDDKTVEPRLGNQRVLDLLNTRIIGPNKRGFTLTGGDLNFKWNTYNYPISEAIAQIMASRLGSGSPLEKMLVLADAFLFKMVHNVEEAAFVPHLPVMHSSRVWRTLMPNEYSIVQNQGYTPLRLQGVGLVGSNWINDTDGTNRSATGKIMGAFRRQSTGVFDLVPAPPWMCFRTPPDRLQSQLTDVRTSLSAGKVKENADSRDDNDKVRAEQEEIVGCNLARAIYFERAYASRSMSINGRLRFDIAPGSAVRVLTFGPSAPQSNTGQLKATAGIDQPGELYGTVESVRVIIDCQDPMAMTQITLSHLRSAEEKDLANTEHPLYPDTPWYGCPLLVLRPGDLKPDK